LAGRATDYQPLAIPFVPGDEFVTTQLRSLVGGTALAAGLWFLSTATAASTLAKETYKKAAEADIVQLQKHLTTCDADAKEAKRYGPTAKAIAMDIVLYAESLGDSTLKDQALKVAEKIGSKDYKEAVAAAKGLTVKPGSEPLTAGGAALLAKFNLDEVMSPFRGAKSGGLNMEKDIRDIRDGKLKVNAADVELLAARTTALLEYACLMPNDKAKTNKANQDEWTKLSKDSIEATKKMADEAAKGKAANDKEIIKQVKLLDAKCVLCHNKYRDD
jgi:hypothetical protein